MFGFGKRKKSSDDSIDARRAKEIEAAEAEHRAANQAYIKAEIDGASSEDIRNADKRVKRALKHLNALTGTYRPSRRI
jgi:hypothetical protein